MQALVARLGPAARGTGPEAQGRGWWPESWAACDLADWPETVSKARGVKVWSDASGHRVDTRRVVSWVDGRGCLGDDTVQVGTRLFERAPAAGVTSYFRERYRQGQRLPEDAVDTGWSRDGTHLWLSSTRALAYLGSHAANVEFWPELTTSTGCD